MTRKEGGTAPQDSPIGFGSRRLLLAPRREKARCRLRLPAPLLRGKATPQLCARAARSSGSASSLPPPPPRACPFVGEGRGAPEAQEAGEGTGPTGCAWPPSWELALVRALGVRSPEEEGAEQVRPAAPLPLGSPAPLAQGRQLCSGRSVPLGSGFGPGPAQAATAGWAPGTWRPGSPDRAPHQSAPAPRALPGCSSRAGARLAWGGAPGVDCESPASMDASC